MKSFLSRKKSLIWGAEVSERVSAVMLMARGDTVMNLSRTVTGRGSCGIYFKNVLCPGSVPGGLTTSHIACHQILTVIRGRVPIY